MNVFDMLKCIWVNVIEFKELMSKYDIYIKELMDKYGIKEKLKYKYDINLKQNCDEALTIGEGLLKVHHIRTEMPYHI
jgi:hypothetical protein